jgi:hypothetical protein
MEATGTDAAQLALLRLLYPMVGFLMGAGMLTADVLAESIQRLDLGAPARGPGVEEMATLVDTTTGAFIANGLYNRFYWSTSNLALHAGAASLLRHVRVDDSIARRPSRVRGQTVTRPDRRCVPGRPHCRPGRPGRRALPARR